MAAIDCVAGGNPHAMAQIHHGTLGQQVRSTVGSILRGFGGDNEAFDQVRRGMPGVGGDRQVGP